MPLVLEKAPTVPYLNEIDEILKQKFPEFVEGDETGVRPVDAPPQIYLLPQFHFLQYMTSYRLRKIDPKKVTRGAVDCIISSAYQGWSVQDANQANYFASRDYDFYRSEHSMTVIGVGDARPVLWTPPHPFYSHEAISAAAKTICWNDDRAYDHEKRSMLAVAIEQELARRGITYSCPR